MKILAVAATLLVFLCCLEVALSYPVHAAKPRELPQAKFQEIAPFRMVGRLGDSSRAYLSESRANMQQTRMFHTYFTLHQLAAVYALIT